MRRFLRDLLLMLLVGAVFVMVLAMAPEPSELGLSALNP